MTVTENSIKVGNLQWFYREVMPNSNTDRPPVLLLHGIVSQSYSWCETMSILAENGWRAIAPDWLGFGFSSKPDRRDFAYTPDAYIEALADFISALEMKKFILVVQGFLGSVGIQYALRNKDKIDRLVILNTPLSPAAKLPWSMQQWSIPLVGQILTQDPLLVDRTLEGGSGFVISDRNLDVYRKPFLNSSEAGRSLMSAIVNLKLSQSMAELTSGFPNWDKPTLIIWGCADPWLRVSEAESLATQKNVELVRLEDAKHYPQEHWPKEISEVMLKFLRRQVSSTS